MNPLPLPEPELPRRRRLRFWLRHVHYEMTVSRPTRKYSRAVEAMIGALLLAVLAAILYPVFVTARSGSHASCTSNLRVISHAMQQYTEDYDATLPSSDHWMEQTFTYTRNDQVFRCPNIIRETGRNVPIQYGYAYNSLLSEKQADTFPYANAIPLCYDSRLLHPNANAPGRAGLAVPPRHYNINLMLFLDGHVGKVDALGKVVKPNPN